MLLINSTVNYRDIYYGLSNFERAYIPASTLNEYIAWEAMGFLRAKIKSGRRGLEWIGSNPMWTACWNKFASDLVEPPHTHTHTISEIISSTNV